MSWLCLVELMSGWLLVASSVLVVELVAGLGARIRLLILSPLPPHLQLGGKRSAEALGGGARTPEIVSYRDPR